MPEEKATTTPMTRERDQLAFQMRERGYFTEEQIKNFEAINPKDKYLLVLVDDKGIVKDENDKMVLVSVTGQQMRDAIGIYKGQIAVGDKRKTLEERKAAAAELKAYIESRIDVPAGTAEYREEFRRQTSAPIKIITGREIYKTAYQGEGIIREAEMPTGNKSSSVERTDNGQEQSAIIRETETMLATVEKNMDALLPVVETGTPTVDAMANAAAQEGRTAVANALNQSGEWKVAQQSGTTLEMLLAQNMADPGLPKEVQKPAGQKTAALVP